MILLVEMRQLEVREEVILLGSHCSWKVVVEFLLLIRLSNRTLPWERQVLFLEMIIIYLVFNMPESLTMNPETWIFPWVWRKCGI